MPTDSKPPVKKIHSATRYDKLNGWALNYSELSEISEHTRKYEFSDMEVVEATILAMRDLGYIKVCSGRLKKVAFDNPPKEGNA